MGTDDAYYTRCHLLFKVKSSLPSWIRIIRGQTKKTSLHSGQSCFIDLSCPKCSCLNLENQWSSEHCDKCFSAHHFESRGLMQLEYYVCWTSHGRTTRLANLFVQTDWILLPHNGTLEVQMDFMISDHCLYTGTLSRVYSDIHQFQICKT